MTNRCPRLPDGDPASEVSQSPLIRRLSKTRALFKPIQKGDRKQLKLVVAPFSSCKDDTSRDGHLPVTIEGVIDDPIERAMVDRLLINFVAKYLGLGEIRVDKWADAIRFVRLGEGTIKMRVSEKPFWTGQETDRRRFADDSVNIRIENQSGHLVGVIQFYNLFTYEFSSWKIIRCRLKWSWGTGSRREVNRSRSPRWKLVMSTRQPVASTLSGIAHLTPVIDCANTFGNF